MIFWLCIVISSSFLIIVLELVRRQKLKEQYSLLWIVFGISLFIASINVSFIERLSNVLGIKYAPAMLFLFGLLFCFTLILHLTMVVTKLSNQVLRLTQELTILKQQEALHGQND